MKMIRHDYPHLHRWVRHCYWDGSPEETRGAFKRTTDFKAVGVCLLVGLASVGGWMSWLTESAWQIKNGYAAAGRSPVVPLGPVPDILPLDA